MPLHDPPAIADTARRGQPQLRASAADLHERLRSVRQAGEDPAERAQALLAALVEGLGALAGAITVAAAGQEVERVSEDGPEGIEAWHQELLASAMHARSHGLAVGRVFGDRSDRPELVVLSAPLETITGEAIGGLALLLPWKGAEHARACQAQLRSAAVIASPAFHQAQQRSARLEVDDFARVLARAGSYRTIEQFAYALTNAAKQRFGCDQAAMGLVAGGHVRVVCISGLDHVKQRSPGVHHIQQAMGECADAGEPLVAQPADQWAEGQAVATGMLHERWRAATAGRCVLSMPMIADDRVVAVLSLARQPSDPFRPEELEALAKLLGPLAAALPVVQRSTRTLASHAKQTLVDAWRWLTAEGTHRRRAAVLGVLALVAWLAFKPTSEHVTTHATIQAGRQVVVASGLDAPVAQVLVRSGQAVAAGQPLVRLDASPLFAQRAHVQGEREAARLRLKHAIATSDPAAAAIAQAELDAHDAALRRIAEQIDAALVRSPIDGVVVSPDIANLPGRLVPVGEPLLTIAQAEAMHLELELPEHRVGDVRPGMAVRFASHARPESPLHAAIEHVEAAATERMGRPVFLAQARLEPSHADGAHRLRPGMEGVAMIELGRKPNAQLLLERALDFARLRFWIE
ncbi:MAG: hypothetical protein KatS3mg103_0214 [Phycisphaerales bacterium]|nr:MAG: hypothetical protein KatS3mg103_0214 [Phycisphaerales bacterium]